MPSLHCQKISGLEYLVHLLIQLYVGEYQGLEKPGLKKTHMGFFFFFWGGGSGEFIGFFINSA